MTGNCHVRCGAGENSEMISKNYLSLFGKIPEFDKILATCRKFEISAVVVLQNLSQLKRMYEKSWEELPGNCDTMVFLGGKDQFTNEYLMKSLGKETIDTVSINKSKGQSGSTSYNDGILGRELLQLNELETLDNSKCIVMIRGLNPFLTDKFEIKNHKRYPELEEAWDSRRGAVNRNQFLVEDNIITEKEIRIVDMSEWIDEDMDIETDTINVSYIDSDNDSKAYTLDELADEMGLNDVESFFEGVEGICVMSDIYVG